MAKNHPLNIEALNPRFYEALSSAWSRATCWPPARAGYRAAVPSHGNCLVSSLAAWADGGFEGQVVPGKINEDAWHFRLSRKLGREIVDPTWQQTDEGSTFRYSDTMTAYHRAEYKEIITGSLADETLVPRLQLLLDNMDKNGGYKTGHTAQDIVKRFRESHAFVFRPDYVENPRVPLPAPRKG